jgi:hypothetical protein
LHSTKLAQWEPLWPVLSNGPLSAAARSWGVAKLRFAAEYRAILASQNTLRYHMHLAESLWQRHHPTAGYPAGVLPVPEPIPGIAFFPGGFGLWRPDVSQPLPPFPIGGIMVLGHDFHSEAGYNESLARSRESESQPTWRQLLRLLKQVDIDPVSCFFTNVYFGLRVGAGTTGPFPGATNRPFVEYCLRFLSEQINTQRPRLILTLGINVPPLIGRLSGRLEPWTDRRGLKQLDAVGPVQFDVPFHRTPPFVATVVALTHPSLRDAGVRHRTYRGNVGHSAELAMLRDGLAPAVGRQVSGNLPKP